MADVEAFWRRFVAATGIDGPYTAWGFGSSPEQATELGLLVRDGPKRGTASLVSSYADDEPMPVAGDLGVIVDGAGEPLCVVRTTAVEVRAFRRGRRGVRLDGGRGRPLARVLARGSHPLLRDAGHPAGRDDARRARAVRAALGRPRVRLVVSG